MKRSKSTQILKYYWKSTAIAVLIAYGSLASGNNMPDTSFFHWEHTDKIVHAAMYLILAMTLAAANNRMGLKQTSLYALIPAIVYGVLMEVLQFTLTATRHAELLDMLANTIGAIAGVLIISYTKKWKYMAYL